MQIKPGDADAGNAEGDHQEPKRFRPRGFGARPDRILGTGFRHARRGLMPARAIAGHWFSRAVW